ncbi:unnamed protein product [Durusdinium trenchii]|uniref:Uncharacterized protein n=1 Tax=Durusdinium trenchii TaxID=1381693 RepID=A0ABP0HDN5_9DINO
MKRDLESVPVVRGVLMGCCLRSKSLPSGSPWLAFALLVAVAHRTGTFCGGAPLLFKRSGRTFAAGRLATDPNFAANVGEATETVRSDHAQIPRLVSALRFSGLTQYREFWDNFRSGVELVSLLRRFGRGASRPRSLWQPATSGAEGFALPSE